MFTNYGPSVNGVRLGFQHDGFELSKDGNKARLRKPRVVIQRDTPLMDISNTLYVSGTVILKQKGKKANVYPNLNCSGSGRKIIKRLTGEWIDLDADKTKNKLLHAELHRIDRSGQPIRVMTYIKFPKQQTISDQD